MATGIPKAQWNGDIQEKALLSDGLLDATLSYPGKSTEKEIIATQPAELKLLWQNPISHPNRLFYGDNCDCSG